MKTNTSSCIGISSMKMISCRNSTIFGFPYPDHFHINNSLKSPMKRNKLRHFRSCSNIILGFRAVVDPNRRDFDGSGSNWGQSGICKSCSVYETKRVSVIANVASDFRNHSTSVEKTSLSENGFESIYIQGGFNVKPLVIETIKESSVETNGLNVNLDDLRGLNGTKEATTKREVSVTENEAWELLRSAVVDYCGSPVGTVAAADPSDDQPLNYDHVFVRDFVPSALAFLLNGEGNIVKNFLLYTLQLQVAYFLFFL